MNKKPKLAFFVLVLTVFSALTIFSLTIPGMIEADVYDNGGEGVGFHDTGSSPVIETNSDTPGNGYHVAYIEAGEWLAYTVTATAGYYNVEVRVAKDPSAPAGGSFHLEFGGVDVSGVQTVPSTGGFTTFATMVVGPIEVLTGGSKVMKIAMDGGPFNINWVNFVTTSESPTPSPSPTPEPTVSPNPPVVRPLHVDGQYIKDDSGNNVKLHGVAIGDLDAIYKGDRKTDSTQAVPITVQEIIDKGADWNINVWRLTVHADVNDETGHHGWNVRNNPQWFFDNIIDPAVSKVISVGDYVIVDWHYVGVSWDDTTVVAKTEEFWLGNGAWTGIAAHYANNPNVIFELFNEPGGGSWSSWKTRAGGWIDRIRVIGANNVIIVGGPGWSQTLPASSADLFSATNIAYACHIYPQHVGSSVPNWIEYTSSVAPVVMTEWGFENTGPAPVSGTAAAYGATFKAYINGKANVSWVAWCFDYIYHSYMFDTNWKLLGNGTVSASTLYFGANGIDKGSHGITPPSDTSENFMGQFTKNWLSEVDNLPTAAPTVAPTAGPTSVPTAAPTLAPTAGPTAVPTIAPTAGPTSAPTAAPTLAPTAGPTAVPTIAPTAGPTSAPTAAPTLAPTTAPGGTIKVQYKVGGDTANDSTIKPYLLVLNNSGAAITLSEYTVRYYYTKEPASSEAMDKYNATCGIANIANVFNPGYIEYGFAAAAGTLVNGASCEIQTAIHTTDWQNYDETNDYSYDSTKTAYTDWPKATLYHSGVIVWGTEPTGGNPTAAPTAVPTLAPTAAPTAVSTLAPTAAPTAVSTLAPTAAPTAVPTLAPTAAPTAVPTLAPTAAPGSIQLQYQCGMTATTSMEMTPWYKIVNGGSTALNWTGIEIRYYFVRDAVGATFRTGNLVYPNNLQNNLTITIVNVSGDNFYAKMTFSGTSEVIAAGATTGDCKQTIYEDNTASPSQANDYSFDATKTAYAAWTKMVVLYNSVVVSGTVPY